MFKNTLISRVLSIVSCSYAALHIRYFICQYAAAAMYNAKTGKVCNLCLYSFHFCMLASLLKNNNAVEKALNTRRRRDQNYRKHQISWLAVEYLRPDSSWSINGFLRPLQDEGKGYIMPCVTLSRIRIKVSLCLLKEGFYLKIPRLRFTAHFLALYSYRNSR